MEIIFSIQHWCGHIQHTAHSIETDGHMQHTAHSIQTKELSRVVLHRGDTVLYDQSINEETVLSGWP